MRQKKYSDLSFNDKVAYLSAIAAFVLGWLMVWASFFVSPLGEISDGPLWILGQSLLYISAVLGISAYTVHQVRTMKKDLGLKDNEDEE